MLHILVFIDRYMLCHYSLVLDLQDSIAALQALVEYAKRDTNRALYNVEVVVEATSMGNWSQSVGLDSSNWPSQQEVNVSGSDVMYLSYSICPAYTAHVHVYS